MKVFNGLTILAIFFFITINFTLAHQPDLNGDKFIDFLDFKIVGENWKKTGAALPGDIDNNGIVDFADLDKLADNWLQYTFVIFVDANAAPNGDGCSWNTAFIYLQDAIAVSSRDYTIWVAKGIYKPDANSSFPAGTGLCTSAFHLPQGVGIYGGFPKGGGTFYQRNWINNETILSGDIGVAGIRSDNCYNVVFGANDVTLNGFTIADGNAVFTGDYARGSGIRNESIYNEKIENCIFRNNYARYDGGAAFNYKSSVSFMNCIFNENISGDDGAGIYNSNADVNIISCRFFDNLAQNRAGGVYNYESNVNLINCLFKGNYADSNGGAVYNGYESVKLINCTIAQNSSGKNTGGIFNMYSSPFITNCVIWDNGKSISNKSCNPHIAHCDLQYCGGSGANWDANCGKDEGFNIQSDPCFTADLALKAQSLCIDAGTDLALPPGIITDVNGDPRFNWIVDIGAFEYQH